MMKKRKVTGVRMPKELDKKISDAAGYLGTTKNGLIIQILWEYVNERENQNGSSIDKNGKRIAKA